MPPPWGLGSTEPVSRWSLQQPRDEGDADQEPIGDLFQGALTAPDRIEDPLSEILGIGCHMDIGSSVYDYGLASRTGNANRLWQTDVGINWWMTQYLKMVLDWNHEEFNNPVTYNTQKYS